MGIRPRFFIALFSGVGLAAGSLGAAQTRPVTRPATRGAVASTKAATLPTGPFVVQLDRPLNNEPAIRWVC